MTNQQFALMIYLAFFVPLAIMIAMIGCKCDFRLTLFTSVSAQLSIFIFMAVMYGF